MFSLLARRMVVLVIVAIAAGLTLACILPVLPVLAPAQTGTLKVTIDYTGTWYRETFGYTRQAVNIQHIVLVVPKARQDEINPAEIFSALLVTTDQGDVPVTDIRPDLQWVLDYLHDAPAGYYTGEFEPGDYAVAAAFVAAPLSREEAGVSEDMILYGGITGGGASTGYRDVVIEPGKTTTLTVTLTDDNGWACPWLYVFDGHAFERRTEILRNLNGKNNEQTEVTYLGLISPVEGAITLKIAEEKDEITFVDVLYLIIDGVPVYADAGPASAARLAHDDQDYLVIASGESYTFRFDLPGRAAGQSPVPVSVVVTGYYSASY